MLLSMGLKKKRLELTHRSYLIKTTILHLGSFHS